MAAAGVAGGTCSTGATLSTVNDRALLTVPNSNRSADTSGGTPSATFGRRHT
jgi:hypothetical protein